MPNQTPSQRSYSGTSPDSAAGDSVLGEYEPREAMLSYAQLEARANILKAMKHTEAALLAISDGRLHYTLIDLYIEAMRELQALLDANMLTRQPPITPPEDLVIEG